ncbi:hypothetical protein EV641_109202 [Rhodococcus sp. SMB37]|uniref:hypothetical protein n=1 Tax=Rhodococcus sp. SMB37 TaxID=2512213 RepID=UPI001049B67E|nr:hypothetical protein [Rhodococcus sp. SMB37]TCN51811.1 hypothetical protein EV641_109202 [Rhodococcus sp. SMB37]
MTILPTWLYDRAVERFGQAWMDKNGYERNELVTPTPEFQYSAGGEDPTGCTVPIRYVSRDALEEYPVNQLDVVRQRLNEGGGQDVSR